MQLATHASWAASWEETVVLWIKKKATNNSKEKVRDIFLSEKKN